MAEVELPAEAFRHGLPFVRLDALRRERPVFRDVLPDGTPVWNLVRYHDVAAALRSSPVFEIPTHDVAKGERGTDPNPHQPWAIKAMMALNAPEHGEHRQKFIPLVRRPNIEEFRGRVRGLAETLASDLRRRRDFDAVDDFAAVLAPQVVGAYLGIDDANVDYFRRLSAVFMGDTLPAPCVGARAGLRLDPSSVRNVCGSPARAAMDLIRQSWSEVPWLDGRFVRSADRWDVEDLGLQLLSAGVAGLRNCIASGVWFLASRWDELRADRAPWIERLSLVANEVIRLTSPLLRARRVAAEDQSIGGHDIRAGDTVLLWLVGANTDPERFPEPSRFLPFRAPNAHLSFGAGPHTCLGGSLAHMEVEEVLRAIITGWDSLSLRGEPERFPSNVVNEMSALPVTVL